MQTRISALDVKKKEFEQKMRGYDQVEVKAYLELVSQELDALTIEKAQAEHELSETKKRLEHFLSLEQTLERTLVGAQQTAIKMEEQARKEAELIRKDAELQRQQALMNISQELNKAQGELFRLRAEYESTIVRMRSLMAGFSQFMTNIEADAKLAPPSPTAPVIESTPFVSPTPADAVAASGPGVDFSL